jgi:cellulose synthase/poly-beta-1,6-N-acetylglucosamine synthase-like glycosyltransferase
MDAKQLLPKVLVCAPTSARHQEVALEWLKSLDSLTYPNFDVCLVDNTLGSDDYLNVLKEVKVKGNNIITWKHNWSNEKQSPLQMLAHCRESIRQYFLEHTEYSYLFWLDDDVFIPKDTIQKLIVTNKDHIGLVVPVFYKPNRIPCILKSGDIILGKGLNYYSFDEINAYKTFATKFKDNKLSPGEKLLASQVIKDEHRPYLMKAYAVNVGCLMVKREVVEKLPFRSPENFVWGEDCWYFQEANDKKFEFWCDVSLKVVHKNTDWNILIENKNSGPITNFSIIHGPAEGGELVTVDYGK